MQKYAKIRTVLAKTCRNMQKICKKYAKICNKICRNMQKYANKICKNMQNICKNIRVYVFAYICNIKQDMQTNIEYAKTYCKCKNIQFLP